MCFEWDAAKDRINQAKHGLSFDTAALVFDDPLALCALDCVVDGEERWHILGMVGGAVVLLVVYTHRDGDQGEVVRIISARKATKRERQSYEEAHR